MSEDTCTTTKTSCMMTASCDRGAKIPTSSHYTATTSEFDWTGKTLTKKNLKNALTYECTHKVRANICELCTEPSARHYTDTLRDMEGSNPIASHTKRQETRMGVNPVPHVAVGLDAFFSPSNSKVHTRNNSSHVSDDNQMLSDQNSWRYDTHGDFRERIRCENTDFALLSEILSSRNQSQLRLSIGLAPSELVGHSSHVDDFRWIAFFVTSCEPGLPPHFGGGGERESSSERSEDPYLSLHRLSVSSDGPALQKST